MAEQTATPRLSVAVLRCPAPGSRWQASRLPHLALACVCLLFASLLGAPRLAHADSARKPRHGNRESASRLPIALACTCLLMTGLLGAARPGQASPGEITRKTGEGYQWFCRGNAEDVVTAPTFGLQLEGGGDDLDDAFRWLNGHANGGDVVVLRASGGDDYNEYIESLGPTINSVQTLIVTDERGARDPFVIDRVKKAEAIFVAGGDQSDYVRLWKNSPLGDAIQQRVLDGVPIGGTSAGLAILGQHVFTAAHDTIDSASALANPHDERVALDSHFLRVPLMNDVITDTHFVARDRMGRLTAFLSRIMQDGAQQVRGIAVDEKTAVLVEADGQARVTGLGTAYFLETRPVPSDDFKAAPLEVHDIDVQRVAPGGQFNLSSWTGNSQRYRIDVEKGVMKSSRPNGGVY